MNILIKIFKFSSFIILIIYTPLLTMHAENIPKKAGICFRIDDNQSIEKYLEFAEIFDKYDKNFSFALNLDLPTISENYIHSIKMIQSNGHEMMDHTPSHKTNFFYTILDPTYFNKHTGVNNIIGNKITLKHKDVNINESKRNGYVNIDVNIISSSSPVFSEFSKSDCYLYFPEINKLVYINDYSNGWIDDYTVKVTDIWGSSIDLGQYSNIRFYNFDVYNIHLTAEAISALAEETIRLSDHFSIQRPYSWIQPGGYNPFISSGELKIALSENLGYKTAGAFSNPSLKVFNEFNPDGDKQFGMNWGDFYEDTWTLEKCKNVIANRTAKHNILIGHSHFSGLLDGWDGYLRRVDSLLDWCVRKDIPIRTYSEWAEILYNEKADPFQNVFPSLNTDKDNNGYPDGYLKKYRTKTNWIDLYGELNNDGPTESNNHSFSINKAGNICYVGREYYYTNDGLGGLEKGENSFEIWTKGSKGNFIEVDFLIGNEHYVYKFPAESENWEKYNLEQSFNGYSSLLIPENVSIIDIVIRCSNYSGGTVKISGMSLKKKTTINSAPVIISEPICNGKINHKYYYNVEAEGFPLPIFSLIQAPSGMTIENSSGIINWMPNKIGEYDIEVMALNGMLPDAKQCFKITVIEEGSNTDCPTNILSYWKLDEQDLPLYYDEIYSNNGKSLSPPSPSIGIVDGGQLFNGTTNYIYSERIDEYDFEINTSFSFEAWIKHPNAQLFDDEIVLERKSGNSALAISLKFESTRISFLVRSNAYNEIYSVESNSSLFDNCWHHVVGIRDANENNIKLYVDGELNNTTNVLYSSGFLSSTEGISIGYRRSTNSNYYKGELDELAIYKTALDESDIIKHYENGLQNIGYCTSSELKYIYLDLKVLLEGAYKEDNTMNNNLIASIPLSQPYNKNPWNYNGLESIGAITDTDIIDWVLVSLYSEIDNTKPSSQRAGFVRKYGKIVDIDGYSPLKFSCNSGKYYVKIEHRNHLSIFSNESILFE